MGHGFHVCTLFSVWSRIYCIGHALHSDSELLGVSDYFPVKWGDDDGVSTYDWHLNFVERACCISLLADVISRRLTLPGRNIGWLFTFSRASCWVRHKNVQRRCPRNRKVILYLCNNRLGGTYKQSSSGPRYRATLNFYASASCILLHGASSTCAYTVPQALSILWGKCYVLGAKCYLYQPLGQIWERQFCPFQPLNGKKQNTTPQPIPEPCSGMMCS